MQNFILPQRQKEHGFTLIELLVVMVVFIFIIAAVLVVFISIAQAQKNILAKQEVIREVGYILEYLSKALRMAKTSVSEQDSFCLSEGVIYQLTRADPNSPDFFNGIKFINSIDNDSCYEIFFDNKEGVLKQLINETEESNALSLTSTNLKIEFIKFKINGMSNLTEAKRDDDFQPRITILLGVKSKKESGGPLMIFQTTVSQRSLNIK